MATTIAVAGATGFLGGRIVKALIERGADVRALVRDNASSDKLAGLESLGAKVAKVDLSNAPAAARALAGASCIVSTIQGLRDAIVDAQSALLEAAIAAGVPRFIPSDYSVDFTKLEAGENRNFDLRREFHERLDKASIRSTSILSGANMELLTRAMPLLDLKSNRVTYWGKDPDQRLDFTATDDTATFTAAAALDPGTPNILRIAGDQISARELAILAGEITGATFDSFAWAASINSTHSSVVNGLRIPKARTSFSRDGSRFNICTTCSAAAPSSRHSTTAGTPIFIGRK